VPRNLAGAKSGLDRPLQEKAIVEELATLKGPGTWKMSEIPERADIVGSEQVFLGDEGSCSKFGVLQRSTCRAVRHLRARYVPFVNSHCARDCSCTGLLYLSDRR